MGASSGTGDVLGTHEATSGEECRSRRGMDVRIRVEYRREVLYEYKPNPNGPVITPKNGYFEVSRTPKSVENQWTKFRIKAPKPVATGLIHQFNISYSKIEPHTEVKLTLAGDAILRYDGTKFSYVYWTNDFQPLGPSAIKVNGKVHQVNIFFSPSALVIFEDGNFIAQWKKTIPASLEPIFDWQILAARSSLDATLSGLLVDPSSFPPTVQTPWDLALTSKWSLPTDIWTVKTSPNNPIPVTYTPDYMRAAVEKLATYNSWVFPSVTLPAVKPVGIVTYRMRVNQSGGSESKITVIGDNILRITDNGNTVLWTLYDAHGQFVKLAVSTIKVGSGKFTDVTVIYAPNAISLFEDGVLLYTRAYSPTPAWSATWSVQHLDVNTAISADLAYVRMLPLAMDHPPANAPFNIFNFKYDNRVVDLSGSMPTGPVIGYGLNGPPPTANQQWSLIEPDGSTKRNTLLIRSGFSSPDRPIYAIHVTNVAGAPIFGNPVLQTFDITPIPDLGLWSITITGNPSLSLQLSSKEPRTQLILFSNQVDPNDGQKWQLVRA